MARTREDMLAELQADPRAEVLVVGGGINGISAFRELALQGVDVLLVDRGDFCGACSSAPSRMIHGGLRYLENGEIGLVRESLRERDALLRNAPHFVRPLPTTVPIQHAFTGLLNGALGALGLRSAPAARGAVAVKVGLALYDSIARERPHDAAARLSRARGDRGALARPGALGALLRHLLRRLDQLPGTARDRADRRRSRGASRRARRQPPRREPPRRRPHRAHRPADRRRGGGDRATSS